MFFFLLSTLDTTSGSMDKSDTIHERENDCTSTAVIASVVSSVAFLLVGALLGAVGLYLLQRVRGKLSDPTSPSPLPPPATYEEVGVAGEVKSSRDIQMTPNEAYGHAS